MILLKLLQWNSNIVGKFEIQLELRTTLAKLFTDFVEIYKVFAINN